MENLLNVNMPDLIREREIVDLLSRLPNNAIWQWSFHQWTTKFMDGLPTYVERFDKDGKLTLTRIR